MNTIPADLIVRNRWVTWTYEADPQRPDRPRKVPKNARTGRNASTTNAATWTDYATAAAAAAARQHAGVGFVFVADDDLVGIDLDDCINDDGELTTWAAEIVAAMDSYTEISPSGRGLKIWIYGTLTDNVRTPSIEIYQHGRYFTVTGRAWPGTPNTVRGAHRALDALVARLRPPAPSPARPITPLPESRHGERWAYEKLAFAAEQLHLAVDGQLHNRRVEMARLVGGVIAHGYLDTEYAVATLLDAHPPSANRAQEERAIRDGIKYGIASPLVVPTFPTEQAIIARNGSAYCPSCNGAITRSRYAYPGSDTPGWYCPSCRHPMVWPVDAYVPGTRTDDDCAARNDWSGGATLAELQRREFPPEVWIVEQLLPPGACLLAAKPKARKSWLALHVAISVATGTPFLGRYPTKQGRVLFLDLEGTLRRTRKRSRAMLGVAQAPWPDNLHVYTEWPQGDEATQRLADWFRDFPDTVLVVGDVLASLRRPMDKAEAYYQYDRVTVKPLNDLCEQHDCAILLVHHLNKARVEDVFESISGSTGLVSVTNTQWVLGRSNEDRAITIFSMQGRDIEHDEPLALRWDDYQARHTLEGKAAEVIVKVEYEAILGVLSDDQARTPREIAEALGLTVNAVKLRLRKMLDEALVDKAGYGKYALIRRTPTVPPPSALAERFGRAAPHLASVGYRVQISNNRYVLTAPDGATTEHATLNDAIMSATGDQP
jgi:hypothetical protein